LPRASRWLLQSGHSRHNYPEWSALRIREIIYTVVPSKLSAEAENFKLEDWILLTEPAVVNSMKKV